METISKFCKLPGCLNKHYGKGFCKKHHQWHWKNNLLPKTKTDEEVFYMFANVSSKDACWEWSGSIDSNGYGSFRRGKFLRAHRYSYSLFVGKVPDNLFVLHKCNNRKCVNPDHLYAGTHQQNMKDMADSGIQKGGWRASDSINKETAIMVFDKPIYRGHKDINPKFRGEDTFDNMMPACIPCNLWKKTFSIEEFREEIAAQVERLRRDSAAFRMAKRYDLVEATGESVEFYFEIIRGDGL